MELPGKGNVTDESTTACEQRPILDSANRPAHVAHDVGPPGAAPPLIRRGRGLNGRHNVLIARTPTQVRRKNLSQLIVGRVRVFGKGADGASRTRACKSRIGGRGGPKRLLQRVEGIAVAETFDGCDRNVAALDRKHETGTDGMAVDQDGAGAAYSVLTSEVRVSKPARLPQGIGERQPSSTRVAYNPPLTWRRTSTSLIRRSV